MPNSPNTPKKQKKNLLNKMQCRRKSSQSRHSAKEYLCPRWRQEDKKKKLVQCWELHNIFLNLNLEDKVYLEVEGNDKVVL